MASTVSGSTAFTLQTEPETGTFKRRLDDVTKFLFDSEEGKILGKSIMQWGEMIIQCIHQLKIISGLPEVICLHFKPSLLCF